MSFESRSLSTTFSVITLIDTFDDARLSGWGFTRVFKSNLGSTLTCMMGVRKRFAHYAVASDEGCYYHQCFLRGVPEITCLIRRNPEGSQGKSIIRKGRHHQEPDFAAISKRHPLPETTNESRNNVKCSGVLQRQMSVSFHVNISPIQKAVNVGEQRQPMRKGLHSSGSGRSGHPSPCPPPPPTGASLDIWSIFD